ncbi:MAG TPA: DMT family transporter [Alphaproteobacteria bacterium]|nr:DMT family transporter [Alphaproteobacteria bacterium]
MAGAPLAASRLTSARGVLAAWTMLLAAGLSWGATYSLAKIAAMQEGAYPLGIALWQGVFGMVILSLVETTRRRRLPFDYVHLRFYLICGLLGTAIPSTLYFYAAPHLPAGVLAITLGLTPLLTFVGALLFRLDYYAPGRLLGVALGVAAMLMIALPQTSLPERGAAIWVAVALAAALSYAVENIIIARLRPPRTQSLTLLWGMMLVATLALLPVVLATESFVPFAWPWGTLEWTIFGMAAINVLSYWVFVYLVTASGPIFASQMAYVIIVSGLLWGLLLFAERHSNWIWGAFALMLVGLALVAPRKRRSADIAQEPEKAAG